MEVLYTCALTERDQESSILRASVSLGVKTSVCTRATIIKDKDTNGDATCTCRYMQATICGSEPLHKADLIRVHTFVLQHTCPRVAVFWSLYFQSVQVLKNSFVGENFLEPDLSQSK